MCGRFSLTISIEAVCQRFEAVYEGKGWQPRYNIAPAQEVLTVVADETGKRKVVPMFWGLVPSWSKDRKIGYRMINARSETVHEKPSFKKPLKSQRCLVPTDGFYEWKKTRGSKSPLRIIRKDKALFAMAGVWDRWRDRESDRILHSFTIITTPANSLLQNVHDRMPAILQRENESSWLDPGLKDNAEVRKMLQPFPSEKMEFYEVSQVVNSWKHDVKECVLPINPEYQ